MSEVVGFVVGGTAFGEAHRVVRVLTRDRGKISLLARNARSSKKFRGVVELGSLLRLRLGRSKGSLVPISEATELRAPVKARGHLEGIALLQFGCEVVGGLSAEEERNERLYDLLEAFFVAINVNKLSASHSHRLALALEVKALTFAGLLSSMARCVQCGDGLDAPVVLSQGGLMHGRCGGGRGVAIADAREAELLRRTPLAEIGPGLVVGARWALAEHQLGRAVMSRTLLAAVKDVS